MAPVPAPANRAAPTSHDHDYERSYLVRGCNRHAGTDAKTGEAVDTLQPRPVPRTHAGATAFDTSHGTIHLILGGKSPVRAHQPAASDRASASAVAQEKRFVPVQAPGPSDWEPARAHRGRAPGLHP